MNVQEQGTNQNKWIWIGLGAAILFCCCAVVVGLLVFGKIGQQVAKGMKIDPAEASKSAHAIADYDLPEGYQEQFAIDFGIYTVAMIGPANYGNGASIMLAQFSQTGISEQQMEDQVRQAFEQQSGNRGRNMKLVDTKKMTIRGGEREVSIYEGTDQNGNNMRELLASFPGKNGVAMLMIMGNTDDWDQKLVDDFIKSIR